MSFRLRIAPRASARARAQVVALLAVGVLAAACGRTTGGNPADNLAVRGDAGAEISCRGGKAGKMANGQGCGCAADCASGFCADGVCCESACTDTCKSCNVPGASGLCTFVPAGTAPSSPTACHQSDVATCGLDGTCDGQGSCRQYPVGTVCKAGTCQSGAVVGAELCDGAGRCEAGPQIICAPFNCDTAMGQCFPDCRSDADCAPGIKCVSGSCGPKPQGAVCTKGSQCASGFCADAVCCNVACGGPCVSCNQPSRQGTCWPVDAGIADPHKVCQDHGAATCGQTGTCDGVGGCALYKVETVCSLPSCSGDTLTTAGTCNGLGSCRMPLVEACTPYRCSGGACILHCSSDADCVAGQSCQNGSCGPKPNGQACVTGGECASGFCVDGICCNTACAGSCRSCALPSALGSCSPVPAGIADPRGGCTDQGTASCGTDGKCDGAAGCRKYNAGTTCAPERCANGAYTASASCDGAGRCVAPAGSTCAPFACNGSRCFNACTTDANCTAGNSCVGNSCGKAGNGAICSTGTQCASGICAQGVCCATACTGRCMSCALSGKVGTCAGVPAGGADPSGTCKDQGTASCGNNGLCDGAAACQSYPAGTACGGGVCQAGACKVLSKNGTACKADGDCASGHCTDGFCCGVASCGSCHSCGLKGSEGTCAPVPAGTLDAGCPATASSTCGTTGACDATGKCAVYTDGTACGLLGCSTAAGGIATPQCSKGTCVPVLVTNCAPFNCDPTTNLCNTTCTKASDCAPGYSCNASGGGGRSCH